MVKVSDSVASVTEQQIRESASRFDSRREWAAKEPLEYEAALMMPGNPDRNLFSEVTRNMSDRRGLWKDLRLKVMDNNWYGFDHEVVAIRFDGELSYVGTFCVNKEYRPVAVYRAAKPDRGKGHKEFMLLQVDPDTKAGMVRGMELSDILPFAVQDGLHCLWCDTFVYSIMRHDCHGCECGDSGGVSVDGGKDYTRVVFGDGSKFKSGKMNLITGEYVEEDKP